MVFRARKLSGAFEKRALDPRIIPARKLSLDPNWKIITLSVGNRLKNLERGFKLNILHINITVIPFKHLACKFYKFLLSLNVVAKSKFTRRRLLSSKKAIPAVFAGARNINSRLQSITNLPSTSGDRRK